MRDQRICLWDNTKFFLILCVVIGHFIDVYTKNSESFQSLYVFIYAFHMPLFIMISGMFHKNERVAEKVISYIVIGALCRVYLSTVNAVINGNQLEISFFTASATPWFMYALAAFVLLTYLLRNIDPKKQLIFFVILACIAGYDSSIGDFMCLSRILVFYPYYILGEMLNKEKLVIQARSKKYKLLGATILCIWGCVCIFWLDVVYKLRPMMTGRNSYLKLGELCSFGFAIRLLCYALCIITCFAVIWIMPAKQLPVITKFGSRTLQIYFWHRGILSLICLLPFIDVMITSREGKIIYLCMALGLTLILGLKPFRFPTKWIVSGKKKNNCNNDTHMVV